MPVTESSSSSSPAPFASLGRSILSLRREQVHAMDATDPVAAHAPELDDFQRIVAELFHELAAAPADEILSIAWMQRLLDAFLLCLEEFRAALSNRRSAAARPPLDRLVADFFERAVKALDVCNAIRDGIDQVHQWEKHLEIVVAALSGDRNPLGEGQLRRAKKALTDLALVMVDEKEGGSSLFTHRNRSFGRAGHSSGKDDHRHFRSLSWSVSRSWSAARQLQAIGNNLAAPRGHEVVATNGLAILVYTMSSVLVFVMWALVAAFPCQDRGLSMHFSIPKSYAWAAPISSLHERILEESKRKDRKHANGLLKEINRIDRCSRQMLELLDTIQFPLVEEKEMEVKQEVKELAQVCNVIKELMNPMERQVRDVFHKIIRSRTDGLDCSAAQS